MRGRGVRKLWRIRDDNRAESIAAAAADHIYKQHEPQPEKPLHSNSMEKGSVSRKPILYREPGKRGNQGPPNPCIPATVMVRSEERQVWLPRPRDNFLVA